MAAVVREPAARPQVRIALGERPEQATHVSVEAFDGPLALLLALIEHRELDILEVPLGDLAGAYLEEVARLPDVQMPHISAFVAICSQLILIKSRALLPRPPAPPGALEADEIDPEAALRERLLLYRRYRDAGAWLGSRLEHGTRLFHREPGVALSSAEAGARPPAEPPLPVAILVEALEASIRLAPEPPPPAEVVPRTVTLEERAELIRSALRDSDAVVLQDLLAGVRDRVIIAITFLAMLELVKEREVSIDQAEPWGPIVCRPATRVAVVEAV